MLILASRHFALLWSSRSLTPFSRLIISSWIGFCAFNCFTCAQPANGRRHSQPTPGITAEFLSALITTIIIISLWPSGSLLVRVFKIIIIHHTAVAITEPRVEQFSWYSDCWYYIRYNQQDWAKLRQSLHIQLNRIPTATNIHSCSNFTYECLSILFCIIYLHIMDGRRKAKKHKNSPD